MDSFVLSVFTLFEYNVSTILLLIAGHRGSAPPLNPLLKPPPQAMYCSHLPLTDQREMFPKGCHCSQIQQELVYCNQ